MVKLLEAMLAFGILTGLDLFLVVAIYYSKNARSSGSETASFLALVMLLITDYLSGWISGF